jgi:hypothetical protein
MMRCRGLVRRRRRWPAGAALRRGLVCLWCALWPWLPLDAQATELPEYRLKAAFLFNFIAFTEWPATTGSTLNLCIHGNDPFGSDLDGLQGKPTSGRTIALQRNVRVDQLRTCQVVFIAASAQDHLPRVFEALRGQPTLTVADSPGAMRRGVALNMNVAGGKVSFEANVVAARAASLTLSSKLLRLATEVEQ